MPAAPASSSSRATAGLFAVFRWGRTRTPASRAMHSRTFRSKTSRSTARHGVSSSSSVSGRSTAAVGNDQVCEDPGGEARGEQQQPELAVPIAPHALPDLADHVEDRACCYGVEGELERLGGDLVADHRADEGGAAADQADHSEPTPR